jgi:peptide/nickel transport system permease protein
VVSINLYKYIAKRILISLPILFGIIVLTFFISRMIPGDPVMYKLPPNFTPEEYAYEKHRLGLDQPILVQFIVYMADLLSGNWGYSLTVHRSITVVTLIAEFLPRSLEIMFITMIFAIFLGVKAGKYMAIKRNKPSDVSLRFVTYIGSSIPTYVGAYLIAAFIILTGITILPFSGIKSGDIEMPRVITNSLIIDSILTLNFTFLLDYLWHLIIPISVLTFIQFVSIARLMRSSMIEVLKADYITVAYSKGCTEQIVWKKHALKNAALPTISMTSMNFTRVLASFIPLEVAFNLQGVGRLFHKSLTHVDYNLMVACVFTFAISALTFNILADVLFAIIDPRIRYQRSKNGRP